MDVDIDLLRRIDRYLDAVPRAAVRTERIGPFSLFINDAAGWRYYARPTPGATAFTRADVMAVRERQRELRQPEEIEWVVDVAPGVADAGRAAGLRVIERPLMRVGRNDVTTVAPGAGVEVRLVTLEDDLAELRAVSNVGFAHPGTAVSDVGTEVLADARPGEDDLGFVRDRLRRGLTAIVGARVAGRWVATGSHQPLDGATEITGVATLPAFRRRGLAAAVTSALVADAFGRGLGTVFLSADDETVARTYERVGFRTIGIVGAASPPPG